MIEAITDILIPGMQGMQVARIREEKWFQSERQSDRQETSYKQSLGAGTQWLWKRTSDPMSDWCQITVDTGSDTLLVSPDILKQDQI